MELVEEAIESRMKRRSESNTSTPMLNFKKRPGIKTRIVMVLEQLMSQNLHLRYWEELYWEEYNRGKPDQLKGGPDFDPAFKTNAWMSYEYIKNQRALNMADAGFARVDENTAQSIVAINTEEAKLYDDVLWEQFDVRWGHANAGMTRGLTMERSKAKMLTAQVCGELPLCVEAYTANFMEMEEINWFMDPVNELEAELLTPADADADKLFVDVLKLCSYDG